MTVVINVKCLLTDRTGSGVTVVNNINNKLITNINILIERPF